MDFHPGGDLLSAMERNEGGMSEVDTRSVWMYCPLIHACTHRACVVLRCLVAQLVENSLGICNVVAESS